jgi:hypothetical protein
MDAQNGLVAAELASVALEERHLDFGEIAREQGDVKRAVLLLKRAIDDDPTLASARALLDALHE